MTTLTPMANDDAVYGAVDAYARKRIAEGHDTYGWGKRPQPDGRPGAVLLVARNADRRTFPSEIDGVPIELESMPEPVPAGRASRASDRGLIDRLVESARRLIG